MSLLIFIMFLFVKNYVMNNGLYFIYYVIIKILYNLLIRYYLNNLLNKKYIWMIIRQIY